MVTIGLEAGEPYETSGGGGYWLKLLPKLLLKLLLWPKELPDEDEGKELPVDMEEEEEKELPDEGKVMSLDGWEKVLDDSTMGLKLLETTG